jgi:hypothetical protein
MVALGVRLSAAGLGDYWDDVDRWVRNDFAEQQLTSVDWIYRMAERQPRKPVAANEVAEKMPERNVGAFAGWSSGNDWTIRAGIMHGCTGNSTRALYYLWENLVSYEQDTLRVNLLLNRASRVANVYSYIPYQGRVDLKIKEPCGRVLVRAPEWISTGSTDIVFKANGAERSLSSKGRYVDLGPAKAGETFVITFPISERALKEKIGPQNYSLVLKGSTVVSIDPPGRNLPLYADRGRYRKDEVRWSKLSRFVPDETINW